MRRGPLTSCVPDPASSHLLLFEAQRETVRRKIKEVSEFSGVDPWTVVTLVLDVRSEFGREIALRLLDRVLIDRTIREAEARGEPPGLTVALPDFVGIAIIRLFTPSLEHQVLLRPAMTAAILIVDEFDAAIIGITGPLNARLLDATFAVS